MRAWRSKINWCRRAARLDTPRSPCERGREQPWPRIVAEATPAATAAPCSPGWVPSRVCLRRWTRLAAELVRELVDVSFVGCRNACWTLLLCHDARCLGRAWSRSPGVTCASREDWRLPRRDNFQRRPGGRGSVPRSICEFSGRDHYLVGDSYLEKWAPLPYYVPFFWLY